jgi:conjugative transposon TraK protein
MDKLIKHFNDIEQSFKVMKYITTLALGTAAVVILGAMLLYTNRTQSLTDTIYVVDRGSAVMANRSPEDGYRDIEADDHVLRFHELMLNVTPNAESIKRNIDRALILCDKSAYDYYMDLSEKGFYQRMISANITQEFVADSVRVNMESYPYKVTTYGKLYLMRESNINLYEFESQGQLVEVERSPSNPHGLMLEKFHVTRNENIGSRRRN